MGNANLVYGLESNSTQNLPPYTYITKNFIVSGKAPLSFEMARTLDKLAKRSVQSKSCEEEE